MFKKILVALLVAPLVLLFLNPSESEARPRVYPIYKPDVIKVEGMSLKNVREAVRRALFKRRWQTKKISSTKIRATYTKRGRGVVHKAVVDVSFSKKSVRIKYHHSEFLNYDKAAGTIHGTYNKWIQNMERDIRYQLGVY